MVNTGKQETELRKRIRRNISQWGGGWVFPGDVWEPTRLRLHGAGRPRAAPARVPGLQTPGARSPTRRLGHLADPAPLSTELGRPALQGTASALALGTRDARNIRGVKVRNLTSLKRTAGGAFSEAGSARAYAAPGKPRNPRSSEPSSAVLGGREHPSPKRTAPPTQRRTSHADAENTSKPSLSCGCPTSTRDSDLRPPAGK